MQTISYIICNSGDGSNHIEWFDRALTDEELESLEYLSLDTYSSGDGVQYNEMHFPDEFSVLGWAGANYISFLDFSQHISDLAAAHY